MNEFERLVRAHVIQTLRDTARAPTVAELASALEAPYSAVGAALQALAAEHRLALLPGTDGVWMAHPFSGVATDFRVAVDGRRWYANCVWDGLSILALLGDGLLETHSPATSDLIAFEVSGGVVQGQAMVHFLVPARRFWDDIGFT